MTDDALIEAMARQIYGEALKGGEWDKGDFLRIAKAALSVARPIIEAETYEKCAHLCFMLSDVPPETEADKEASRALTSAGNLMRGQLCL